MDWRGTGSVRPQCWPTRLAVRLLPTSLALVRKSVLAYLVFYSVQLPERPMCNLVLLVIVFDMHLLVRLGLPKHHLQPPHLRPLIQTLPVLHLRVGLHPLGGRVRLVRTVRDGLLVGWGSDGLRGGLRGRAGSMRGE